MLREQDLPQEQGFALIQTLKYNLFQLHEVTFTQ